MGTILLALCFCALSLVLALFVGISPISDKAKIRFMYVGAALSLMAVPMPMMSHYIAGLNDIVDELRYQAVLVFIVVVCCYCFVMANMVKYNVMKKRCRCLRTRWRNLNRNVLL